MSDLRCVPGDLAVVVNATYLQNRGKIIRVVERCPCTVDGPSWVYEGYIEAWHGDRADCIADRKLRPLRPDQEEPVTEALDEA